MTRPFGPDSPEEPQPYENTPSDPGRFFATLNAHDVDYLVIGGHAVRAHGYLRDTRDVDVLARPSGENLARLGAALGELDARLGGVDAHLLGIDVTDAKTLEEGANFHLYTKAGRADVWTDAAELKGARGYAEMAAVAATAKPGGQAVRVLGLEDLEATKLAAGREQDLDDITQLQELQGESTQSLSQGVEQPENDLGL